MLNNMIVGYIGAAVSGAISGLALPGAGIHNILQHCIAIVCISYVLLMPLIY